jgi:hypothetical protein
MMEMAMPDPLIPIFPQFESPEFPGLQKQCMAGPRVGNDESERLVLTEESLEEMHAAVQAKVMDTSSSCASLNAHLLGPDGWAHRCCRKFDVIRSGVDPVLLFPAYWRAVRLSVEAVVLAAGLASRKMGLPLLALPLTSYVLREKGRTSRPLLGVHAPTGTLAISSWFPNLLHSLRATLGQRADLPLLYLFFDAALEILEGRSPAKAETAFAAAVAREDLDTSEYARLLWHQGVIDRAECERLSKGGAT